MSHWVESTKALQDATIPDFTNQASINAIKPFMSETTSKVGPPYLALVGTAVGTMSVAQPARKLKLPRPEGAVVAVDSSLSCLRQQGSWWSGRSSSPQSDTVAKQDSWWPQGDTVAKEESWWPQSDTVAKQGSW